MKSLEILEDLKQQYKNRDIALLEQYVTFIADAKGEGVTEQHHILPVCDFYEFRNSKWNLKTLSIAEHVEAHRILMLGAKTSSTGFAYHLMATTRGEGYCPVARELVRELNRGENNPAKREDVKKKISESKTGISRPDMNGKKFFGADEETAKMVTQKSSEYMTGRVIVRDQQGNVFMTEKSDPRYVSGELVHHLEGKAFQNGNPMQTESGKAKFKAGLERRKMMILNWSESELFDYYLKAESEGSKIFTPNGSLTGNYVKPLMIKGLDVEVYTQKIKQILKGSTTIPQGSTLK